jgi:hypothetical protein
MQRRLVWMGAVACTALAGLAVGGRITAGPHPVNQENFERIRVGMTRAEVEAILRCPPGDYATVEYIPEFCGFTLAGATRWISNDGEVRIWFDQHGRVERAHYFELIVRSRPSLLERIQAWLGL